jgi:hypothetical protein
MSSPRFLLDLLLRDREFGGLTLAFVCRNEPTCLFEQAIHLFEWDALGLWQKCPEENGIGDVADDKEEEIPPAL